MSSLEKKLLDWCDRNKIQLFAGSISILAILIRLSGLDFRSEDYYAWLKPWFDEIQTKGGLAAISQQVGDYNVLYQLIIALMTYLPLHPLTLYKGLSCAFDCLLAACAALIVRELTHDRIRSLLAYAAVLIIPSVFINSAFWAQCDSIYSFFLLAAVYCLLRQKELSAFVLVSIAFQFKLQAVFILPFLLYYYVISRRFSLLHFAIIPLLSIPICLLCGRGPFETFRIYISQSGTYERMSLNFPSIWNLISNNYHDLHTAAVLLTIAVLGTGMLIILHVKPAPDAQNMLNLLILSTWTCVLLLPAMHDRYAYFLIILLLIVAIIQPRMLGLFITCELTTLVCYSKFLWSYMPPAQIPDYLLSCVFIGAYLFFLHRSIIRKERWLPAISDETD